MLTSCAWLALAAGVAHADTQAIPVPTTVGQGPGPTGFNYYQPPGNYTFTWDFTANTPISVTQLGYYNSELTGQPNDGGFGSHLVTLVDVTTAQQLASVTVTATNPVTGAFNYAAIDPVTLNTTDTYAVNGTMTTQYYLVDLNRSVAPAASQINYQFQTGDIFGNSSPPGTYNDFGPNFQFTFSGSGSTCTENRPGIDVIALSGDQCVAAPGTYNPTTTAVPLPTPYNGFAFFAAGGSIDSPGDVTINTSDPQESGGSHAVWAYGNGSLITLEGSTTITTAGLGSHGLYATAGGVISATGAVDITTTDNNSVGVNADGAGSSITLGDTTINTSGQGGVGLFAQDSQGTGAGGQITVNGVLNITTQQAFAYDVFATGRGSQIALNGTTPR